MNASPLAACMRRFAWISVTVFSAACATGSQDPTWETMTITTGSFRGIEIGASKEDTLGRLRDIGVSGVKPVPLTSFEIGSENLEEVDRIRSVQGIRVMNYRGVAIDLFFEDGAVREMRKSVPAEGLSWFSSGESIDSVIRSLRDLLTKQEGLRVFPVVRHAAFVPVGRQNASQAREIVENDAWQAELNADPPRGAYLTLRFSSGRLSQLDYRRSRIPLE